MMIGPTTSRNAHAMVASGSIPIGKSTWMTSRSSSTMTTARAASSATLSVASVPRRAVVLRRVVLQEVEVQEEAHREAVRQGLHRETQAVVAVVPAVMMTTIITHLAAAVEAVGDDVLWDTLRVEIYQKS